MALQHWRAVLKLLCVVIVVGLGLQLLQEILIEWADRLKTAFQQQEVIVQGQKLKLQGHIRLVNLSDQIFTSSDGHCLPLPELPTQPVICTHDPVDDQFISATLKRSKLWEKEYVKHMMQKLQADRSLQLVDIGSNIGVYTLAAASLGSYVLAVEMLDTNNILMQRSLQMNNFTHLVTLVQNAVYKSNYKQLGIKLYPRNFGGSYISEETSSSEKTIPAICMDDLIPLVRAKNVFLKMDIEHTEHHAIACSHQFFSNLNITFVQLEWRGKMEKDATQINKFLTQHKYSARQLQDGQLIPCTEDYLNWNEDLLFVKADSVNS